MVFTSRKHPRRRGRAGADAMRAFNVFRAQPPDGVNAAVPQLRAQEGRVLLPGALPGGTGVGRVSRKLLILLVYIAVLGPTWLILHQRGRDLPAVRIE
jgi:hypothetical protein